MSPSLFVAVYKMHGLTYGEVVMGIGLSLAEKVLRARRKDLESIQILKEIV